MRGEVGADACTVGAFARVGGEGDEGFGGRGGGAENGGVGFYVAGGGGRKLFIYRFMRP